MNSVGFGSFSVTLDYQINDLRHGLKIVGSRIDAYAIEISNDNIFVV
jgi:hypothetical protein